MAAFYPCTYESSVVNWMWYGTFCDTGKCIFLKKIHDYCVYHPLLCSDVGPSRWRRVSRTPSCAAPSSSCPSAPLSWRSCLRSLSSTASSSWWWQSHLWEVSTADRQFLANGKSFPQCSGISSVSWEVDGGLLSGEHMAEAVSPLHAFSFEFYGQVIIDEKCVPDFWPASCSYLIRWYDQLFI